MDELDLQELKTMFLEECREHVDTLEQGLLGMSDAEHSSELLNEVFRAAHSIKGGGATFGFADLAELTHHMETLLDEQRSGRKAIVEPDIELLLEALDVVRELMESLGNEDHPARLALQERLEAAVGKSTDVAENSDSSAHASDTIVEAKNPEVPTAQAGWKIGFKPKPDLLRNGNDPLLLLAELKALGELSVVLDESWLPPWEFFDPKTCYVPWSAELKGDISKAAIDEVFEWVDQDCDLEITPLNGNVAPAETPLADEKVVEPADETVQDQALIAKATEATTTTSPAPDTGSAKSPSEASTKTPVSAVANAIPASTEAASIRVSTEKIDQLMNLVGELVITQSMLSGLSQAEERLDIEQLRERLSELERNTRQLQEGVMRVRMLPVSMGFGRLPRLVRDLSKKLSKKVDLVIEGAETEIDKTVLEQMMDPLVHLVRNAIDHGLEEPSVRQESGKRDTGIVRLTAYHQSGSVVIEIADDGAGIDADRIFRKAVERGIVGPDDELSDGEIQQLLFAPGFSTAEVVSDVSGRGVGMDVVRRNIVDLGGQVDISSTLGKGTTVTVRLPLTLAILDGQLIGCGDEVYVIPLANIIETLEAKDCKISEVPQFGSVFQFRGEYLPLRKLNEIFGLTAMTEDRLIVVMECHGQHLGLVIDEVLGQQQIVIKALEDNYHAVPGVSGATIMSDGSLALIIDPQALVPGGRISNAA